MTSVSEGIGLSRNNTQFVWYAAEADALHHAPGLRALATRKYPDVAFENIGIGVDYIASPPILDVFKLQDSEKALCGAPYHLNPPHVNSMMEYLQTRRSESDKTLETLLAIRCSHGEEIGSHLSLVKWSQSPVMPDSHEGKIPRLVALDRDGKSLETARDEVDQIMDNLGMKTADEWLLGAGDRMKALLEKIDEYVTYIYIAKESTKMADALFQGKRKCAIQLKHIYPPFILIRSGQAICFVARQQYWTFGRVIRALFFNYCLPDMNRLCVHRFSAVWV